MDRKKQMKISLWVPLLKTLLILGTMGNQTASKTVVVRADGQTVTKWPSGLIPHT